jgi:hypothetical protein
MVKIAKPARVSTETKMVGERENAEPLENIDDGSGFAENLRNRCCFGFFAVLGGMGGIAFPTARS